jgi:hypothetical protein
MSFDARPVRRPIMPRPHPAQSHGHVSRTPQAEHFQPEPIREESAPTRLPLVWQALEFEPVELDRRFYIVSTAVLLGIIAYALVSNSPIMAITFILIGVAGYMHLEKEPRIIGCGITKEGVVADRELYAWENIRSFDLLEDENGASLSLETKGSLLSRISIPLEGNDPALVRDILLEMVPEKRYEPSFIDIIGKMLHI